MVRIPPIPESVLKQAEALSNEISNLPGYVYKLDRHMVLLGQLYPGLWQLEFWNESWWKIQNLTSYLDRLQKNREERKGKKSNTPLRPAQWTELGERGEESLGALGWQRQQGGHEFYIPEGLGQGVGGLGQGMGTAVGDLTTRGMGPPPPVLGQMFPQEMQMSPGPYSPPSLSTQSMTTGGSFY